MKNLSQPQTSSFDALLFCYREFQTVSAIYQEMRRQNNAGRRIYEKSNFNTLCILSWMYGALLSAPPITDCHSEFALQDNLKEM